MLQDYLKAWMEKQSRQGLSCAMLMFTPRDRAWILSFAQDIPEEDLTSEGICDETHATALYGLTDHTPDKVRKIVKNFGPVTITLGNITLFRNETEDVLKIDVEGEDIHRLNKLLCTLPNENKYPEYKPHVTIAYLKKGKGDQYEGDSRFKGKKITFDKLCFSPPEGPIRDTDGKVNIPLGGDIFKELREALTKQAAPSALSKPDPRRQLSALEKQEVLDRSREVIGKWFPSNGDPISSTINSPLVSALGMGLLSGGLGAGYGSLLGQLSGNTDLGSAIGGGVGALAGGSYGWMHKKHDNENAIDAMRRLPPGATVRDMKKDNIAMGVEPKTTHFDHLNPEGTLTGKLL